MSVKELLMDAGWDVHSAHEFGTATGDFLNIYFVNFSGSNKMNLHIHAFPADSFDGALAEPVYSLQEAVDIMGDCQRYIYTSKRLQLSPLKRKHVMNIFSQAALAYITQTQTYQASKKLNSIMAKSHFIVGMKRVGQHVDFRPVLLSREAMVIGPDEIKISAADILLPLFSE